MPNKNTFSIHRSFVLGARPAPHILAAIAKAAPERHAAGLREELGQEVLTHRLRSGREAHEGILERQAMTHINEVEERDRFHEVRHVIREEDDVRAWQGVDDPVARHVNPVQNAEIGNREAQPEARDDSAAQPAVPEG